MAQLSTGLLRPGHTQYLRSVILEQVFLVFAVINQLSTKIFLKKNSNRKVLTVENDLT